MLWARYQHVSRQVQVSMPGEPQDRGQASSVVCHTTGGLGLDICMLLDVGAVPVQGSGVCSYVVGWIAEE